MTFNDECTSRFISHIFFLYIYIIMLNYTENSKKLIVNAKIIRNRTTGHTKNKTYKGVLQW